MDPLVLQDYSVEIADKISGQLTTVVVRAISDSDAIAVACMKTGGLAASVRLIKSQTSQIAYASTVGTKSGLRTKLTFSGIIAIYRRRPLVLLSSLAVVIVLSVAGILLYQWYNDPVRSFTRFAARYIENENKGASERSECTIGSVQKTDDLIAPYVAEMTIQRPERGEVQIVLVLRDGKWQYKTHHMIGRDSMAWLAEGFTVQELIDKTNGETDLHSDEKEKQRVKNLLNAP